MLLFWVHQETSAIGRHRVAEMIARQIMFAARIALWAVLDILFICPSLMVASDVFKPALVTW
jgi:hypothetical protein